MDGVRHSLNLVVWSGTPPGDTQLRARSSSKTKSHAGDLTRLGPKARRIFFSSFEGLIRKRERYFSCVLRDNVKIVDDLRKNAEIFNDFGI